MVDKLLITIFALSVTTACGAHEPPPEPTKTHRSTAVRPHWAPRTDAQLATDLKTACTASLTDKKPILLEFSAPWCHDCKTLFKMKGALQDEWSNWHHLVVDVNRFDRHPELLKAFSVGAIAHWNALQPTECESVVTEWPRLRSSIMEPATGANGPLSEDDVRNWLRQARTTTP